MSNIKIIRVDDTQLADPDLIDGGSGSGWPANYDGMLSETVIYTCPANTIAKCVVTSYHLDAYRAYNRYGVARQIQFGNWAGSTTRVNCFYYTADELTHNTVYGSMASSSNKSWGSDSGTHSDKTASPTFYLDAGDEIKDRLVFRWYGYDGTYRTWVNRNYRAVYTILVYEEPTI